MLCESEEGCSTQRLAKKHQSPTDDRLCHMRVIASHWRRPVQAAAAPLAHVCIQRAVCAVHAAQCMEWCTPRSTSAVSICRCMTLGSGCADGNESDWGKWTRCLCTTCGAESGCGEVAGGAALLSLLELADLGVGRIPEDAMEGPDVSRFWPVLAAVWDVCPSSCKHRWRLRGGGPLAVQIDPKSAGPLYRRGGRLRIWGHGASEVCGRAQQDGMKTPSCSHRHGVVAPSARSQLDGSVATGVIHTGSHSRHTGCATPWLCRTHARSTLWQRPATCDAASTAAESASTATGRARQAPPPLPHRTPRKPPIFWV